jgi:streptogramin lyase
MVPPVSVLAQEGAPARALQPPNVPNAKGTDSGAGPACDQLTTYGEMQPPGAPSFTYGPGITPPPNPRAPAPPPPPAPAAPRPAGAAAAGGGGGVPLGAAGIAQRGTVIPDAPQLPYKVMEGPQPPQGTLGFANVNGVGLLKNGRLIVNQRMPMFQLMEYDASGKLTRAIDPNLISRPHGMRIDKDDNIWLTDQQCNIVLKVAPSGEVLMKLGTSGKAGMWDEAKGAHVFDQPTDVAFAPNGDVFVAQGHGGPNPGVVRFDKNGKFITSWSMKREGPQIVAHTIVVNAKGEVWVADREVKVIRVYDVNGKHLRDIPMKNLICGLYIDAKGQLWMTTGMDGMVLKLDWNGKILGYIGKEGFGPTEFGEAHYMTMSADGKIIYVGDTVNNDIKKFVLQ